MSISSGTYQVIRFDDIQTLSGRRPNKLSLLLLFSVERHFSLPA
jgi:hypothetical protein